MQSRPIDKRISRTEEAFKEALIKLCKQKDFLDVSVADLAEASGYSRSAFYARFNSKDEFIKQIVDAEINIYVSLSIDAIENRRTTGDTMLSLFKRIYAKKDLYTLLFQSSQKMYVLSEDYFMEQVYEKLLAMKIYRKLDKEADFQLYVYASLSRILAIIKFWIKQNFKYSPEYIAAQYTLIVYERSYALL